MVRRRRQNKDVLRQIALRRIQWLFQLAERYALCGRLELADRYVFLARKIGMRYLVRIPGEFKRCFCKHCYAYLLPGVSCRVRIHRGRVVMYCFRCNRFMRMPLTERV